MVEPLDIRAAFIEPDKVLGTVPPAQPPAEPAAGIPPAQPPAQPPAEPVKVVPPVEGVATPPAEGTPPAQPPVSDPVVEFKIDNLNRWLEANKFDYRIETEDQLRQVISSLNEVEELTREAQEYHTKKPYFEELENEFQSLVNERDPVNIFGSPEAYQSYLVSQQLAQGRDMSDARVKGLIQNIAYTDMNKLGDLDAVALGWQYDSPRFIGREFEIRRAILNNVGVDQETLDDPDFKLSDYKFTAEQELKLSRLAKTERDRFEAVKTGIKVPDQKDWKSIIQEKIEKKNKEIQANQTRIEQLKTGWNVEAKRVAENMKSFDLMLPNEKGENVVEFSYAIDAEFKQLIPDMVIGYALQHNLQPTQENLKAVENLVKGAYAMKNLEKIMVAHKSEVESKLREQQGRDQHNGRPINTGGPPPDRSKLTEADLANIVAENILKR